MDDKKALMVLTNWFNEDPGGIAQAGRLSKLAGHLGITRQAIYQWKRVPENKVSDVAEFTGIPKHVLRPDLYSENPS